MWLTKTMEKMIVEIDTPEIRLDSLLKYAGLSASGGQSGQLIVSGLVKLDGNVVTEKRKKIRPGQQVILDDQYLITVKAKEI